MEESGGAQALRRFLLAKCAVSTLHFCHMLVLTRLSCLVSAFRCLVSIICDVFVVLLCA
jgi:hypothetical protein